MSSLNNRRGTLFCTAFIYVFLLSCVFAFFFFQQSLHEEDHPQQQDGGEGSSSSSGLQRVWGSITGKGTGTYKEEESHTAVVVHHEEEHHGNDDDSDDDEEEEDEWFPSWMDRYEFMPTTKQIAKEDRICFVHVGKTAGSTMACQLGFDYEACPENHVSVPKGNLPLFTTSMMHHQYNRCQYHDMGMFLFVVRDPFTRMQSWFTYERPVPGQKIWNKKHYASKLELFVDCPFPTLDALGGPKGLGAGNATHCSRDAWRAITGERGFAVHNYYNYRRYFDQVVQQDKDPRIIVLRTEQLEQDWRSIEVDVLNGPEPFDESFTFPHKHASAKEERDLYLSEESTRNICRALCEEIQVYKRILIRAENLDENDFVESMKVLAQHCPVQAENSHCE